jgi:hypothetical protein
MLRIVHCSVTLIALLFINPQIAHAELYSEIDCRYEIAASTQTDSSVLLDCRSWFTTCDGSFRVERSVRRNASFVVGVSYQNFQCEYFTIRFKHRANKFSEWVYMPTGGDEECRILAGGSKSFLLRLSARAADEYIGEVGYEIEVLDQSWKHSKASFARSDTVHTPRMNGPSFYMPNNNVMMCPLSDPWWCQRGVRRQRLRLR